MEISPQSLHIFLKYDAGSGLFVWLNREVNQELYWHSWNSRWAGGPALTGKSRGYCTGSIFGHRVLAYRVAWAMHYGEWPEVIDHINGDRSDNRIVNLRSVTTADNNRNVVISRINKSGFTGVNFVVGRGNWRAVYGKKHLGYFGCITAAAIARKKYEIEIGFTSRQPKPKAGGRIHTAADDTRQGSLI